MQFHVLSCHTKSIIQYRPRHISDGYMGLYNKASMSTFLLHFIITKLRPPTC